ncbi:helix-turn-helix domain-containing protein [Paenibacillus sepulcri]|uniref:AraC family transcriptional regulator n=1 Tax=Paenibacillus sepulcri TaxID=359917 RepID=A0ABS7C115_9BACL|nr:AraC family transcriptional regulator [Paenibacillus sepulcri]
MNLLFEPVSLNGMSLLWGHKSYSDSNFRGFYHWHQCCEMLFVHEGQGTVIVEQQTYEIKRGMLFFFQPFQLHKVYANVSAERPYVRSIMHFDPVRISAGLQVFPERQSLFNLLWQGQTNIQAYDLTGNFEYMSGICDFYERAHRIGKGEHEEEITLLMLQLLSCIQAAGSGSPDEAFMNIAPRPLKYSEAVMQRLENSYAEEFDLEQLAGQLHLSKYYVSRVFRQETGSNITDYLTARRIKQACRLLQTTSLPIDRIGSEVGLPNVSYFIQLFKKVVGVTPLKFRNKG